MGEIVVGMTTKESGLWPGVKDLLALAVAQSNGELDMDYVERKLGEGRMQLWVVADREGPRILAAAVTEFVEYPKRCLLRITLLGGTRLDEWAELLKENFEFFAKSNNADGLEVVGRKGFARKLVPFGFKEKYVVMVRDI